MTILFRSFRRVSLFAALAVGLGACADDATAPRNDAPRTPDQAIIINMMAPDSTSADFTVTPTGGTFRIGKHAVWFPAYSICDPNTSSYGIGTWDQGCRAVDRPVTIHAEVRKIDGREWVDFTPALRFVPSTNYQRWVWIYMRTDAALSIAQAQELNILYTPGFGAQGIDESVDDATLRPYVSGGYVYRRIKHFSGYMVASGRSGFTDDVAPMGEGF